MAIVDKSSGTAAQPYSGNAPVSSVRIYHDCAQTNLANGDDIKVGPFDKDCLVLGGWAKLVTAEGGAGTIDVGTAQDGTELFAAFDVNAAAGTVTALAPAAPIAVGSGTYIWIDANAALDAAVFEIELIVAFPADVP